MKALRLNIHLMQPVLVTHLGAGEENSSEAYNYLPGSSLRGAAIAKYLAQNPGMDIAHDPHARALFFDGTVKMLNGYPSSNGSGRMLPTPLSWRKKKDADDSDLIYDFAIRVETKNLKNPQAVKSSFTNIVGDHAELYSPGRSIQMHNASDERFVKESGTSFVYRYEALAAGENFEAVIVSSQDELLGELLKCLKEQN